MITDAEFWMEIRRRKDGRDDIFKGMLSLIHTHQCRIDACTGSLEEEEHKITSYGSERLVLLKSSPILPQKKPHLKASPTKAPDLVVPGSNGHLKGLWQPHDDVPPRPVAAITVRVLQQVLLYAVPVYKLRYSIPAMSMGWSNSCVIDRPRRQLLTFGEGQGVQVPGTIQGRGCIAGDGFFAMLTNRNEVWASGGLKVSRSFSSEPTSLGRENAMICVATKVVMLAGRGQRLAALTQGFVVRPLSAVCVPTRSVVPSRRVRFFDLGYVDEYHMVGMDSILYKTIASKRLLGTPRRIMSFSQKPVSRVSSGMGFLLVIDQNGHLYTNGRNRYGQLGNGRKQETHRKPYHVKSLVHHFITQVAAGECHSLALTSSGIVYCAGSNDNGQLGLGSDVKEALHFTPVPLPGKCLGIAAGPAGSMFVCEDGQVLTCGLNDCMQLGLETTAKNVYSPTTISLISGVETYTMDFGGYLQTSQTSPSVVPNGQSDNKEHDSPKKGADSLSQSMTQATHASICDNGTQNGEPVSLNVINDKVSHSFAQAGECDEFHTDSIANVANIRADKPHEGSLENQMMVNHRSSELISTPANIPNELNLATDAENLMHDLHIDISVANVKVSPAVQTRTNKVRKPKCGGCCIVL